MPRQKWRYIRISKIIDSNDVLIRGVSFNNNGRLTKTIFQHIN